MKKQKRRTKRYVNQLRAQQRWKNGASLGESGLFAPEVLHGLDDLMTFMRRIRTGNDEAMATAIASETITEDEGAVLLQALDERMECDETVSRIFLFEATDEAFKNLRAFTGALDIERFIKHCNRVPVGINAEHVEMFANLISGQLPQFADNREAPELLLNRDEIQQQLEAELIVDREGNFTAEGVLLFLQKLNSQIAANFDTVYERALWSEFNPAITNMPQADFRAMFKLMCDRASTGDYLLWPAPLWFQGMNPKPDEQVTAVPQWISSIEPQFWAPDDFGQVTPSARSLELMELPKTALFAGYGICPTRMSTPDSDQARSALFCFFVFLIHDPKQGFQSFDTPVLRPFRPIYAGQSLQDVADSPAQRLVNQLNFLKTSTRLIRYHSKSVVPARKVFHVTAR